MRRKSHEHLMKFMAFVYSLNRGEILCFYLLLFLTFRIASR